METLLLEWAVPGCFALCGTLLLALGSRGFATKPWAAAFFLLGAGYAVLMVRLEGWSLVKPLIEDTFFLLGTGAMAIGLCRHVRAAPPLAVMAAVVGLGILGAALSLGLARSVRLETVSVQFACAVLLAAALVRSSRYRRGAGDTILYGAFCFVAAALFVQCAAYLLAQDPGPVANAWQDSVLGFVFKFTGAVIAVVLCFAIVLAVTLSVIEKLRSDAREDALTGVLNRRGFEETVPVLAKRAADPRTLTITVVDIDGFKAVNDGFGHDAGDAVLKAMAELLRQHAGEDGCVARLGGDEFALFSASRSLEEARVAAEAVRRRFSQAATGGHAPLPPRTASFGIAPCSPTESVAVAIARADKLLYAAKQRGRNRVEAA